MTSPSIYIEENESSLPFYITVVDVMLRCTYSYRGVLQTTETHAKKAENFQAIKATHQAVPARGPAATEK